jgi:hypothetical protein
VGQVQILLLLLMEQAVVAVLEQLVAQVLLWLVVMVGLDCKTL